MQHHTFLIFQLDASCIHTSFNSICVSFCFRDTLGWWIEWLKSFSPEHLIQAPLEAIAASRLGRSWDLVPVPDAWGNLYHITKIKQSPCLHSKSGTGELLLVSCSKALWQHLSVYSWDFGLSQSLRSKCYVFWSLSRHIVMSYSIAIHR